MRDAVMKLIMRDLADNLAARIVYEMTGFYDYSRDRICIPFSSTVVT